MRQRARREGALTARPSRPGAGRVGAETQLEPVSLPTPQPARPAPHASAPRTARGRRLLTQPCTPTSLRSLRRPPRPSAPSLRRRWPRGRRRLPPQLHGAGPCGVCAQSTFTCAGNLGPTTLVLQTQCFHCNKAHPTTHRCWLERAAFPTGKQCVGSQNAAESQADRTAAKARGPVRTGKERKRFPEPTCRPPRALSSPSLSPDLEFSIGL